MAVKYREIETISEFIDAIRIRVEVFIKEQGFQPGWEPDEDDKKSRQFIAVENGKTIATARIRESKKGELKIERMAVAKENRKKGVGKGLLKFIILTALKSKPKRIWLNSQLHAKEFYEKNGFKAVSPPFEHYGIMHVEMEYAEQIRHS